MLWSENWSYKKKTTHKTLKRLKLTLWNEAISYSRKYYTIEAQKFLVQADHQVHQNGPSTTK